MTGACRPVAPGYTAPGPNALKRTFVRSAVSRASFQSSVLRFPLFPVACMATEPCEGVGVKTSRRSSTRRRTAGNSWVTSTSHLNPLATFNRTSQPLGYFMKSRRSCEWDAALQADTVARFRCSSFECTGRSRWLSARGSGGSKGITSKRGFSATLFFTTSLTQNANHASHTPEYSPLFADPCTD